MIRNQGVYNLIYFWDRLLDKFERIILIKIQQLKKEKKKAVYRMKTIRIIEEIDNLEFCLNAIDSSRYK